MYSQALALKHEINGDGSLVLYVQYTGDGEKEKVVPYPVTQDVLARFPSTYEEAIVVAQSLMRGEAVKQMAILNSGKNIDLFLKTVLGHPIDLAPKETSEDDAAVAAFSALLVRKKALAKSIADGFEKSQKKLDDVVSEAKAIYSDASDAARARMDLLIGF